jgi:hypothetical protein
MQSWWYFSRLAIVVKMRGDAKEHLGCSKALFDCCPFQLQVSVMLQQAYYLLL